MNYSGAVLPPAVMPRKFYLQEQTDLSQMPDSGAWAAVLRMLCSLQAIDYPQMQNLLQPRRFPQMQNP
jgi:hypothetical protein